MLDAHGADATRWYMYTASPAGSSRRFSLGLVEEGLRRFLLTLWNTYSFFVSYANIDNADPRIAPPADAVPELDRWLLSELNALVIKVTEELEAYDPTDAARAIETFVDDLSNWYVRRSRRRFWRGVSESDTDKQSAYHTLYTALVTVSKLLAPFTPFIAEELYQNLVCSIDDAAPISVHLAEWPKADRSRIDDSLNAETQLVKRICSLGRAARAKAQIKVRQPRGRSAGEGAHAGGSCGPPEERDARPGRTQRKAAPPHRRRNAGRDATRSSRTCRCWARSTALKWPPSALVWRKWLRQTLRRRSGAAGRWPWSNERWSRKTSSSSRRTPTGFASASESGYTVAVSTAITPELADEGLAREVVRRLQDMRREAGFDLADRITTWYEGGPELARVIRAHAQYIQGETLSTELVEGAPPPTPIPPSTTSKERKQPSPSAEMASISSGWASSLREPAVAPPSRRYLVVTLRNFNHNFDALSGSVAPRGFRDPVPRDDSVGVVAKRAQYRGTLSSPINISGFDPNRDFDYEQRLALFWTASLDPFNEQVDTAHRQSLLSRNCLSLIRIFEQGQIASLHDTASPEAVTKSARRVVLPLPFRIAAFELGELAVYLS